MKNNNDSTAVAGQGEHLRAFWASIDPPTEVDRSEAALWRLFTYIKTASGGQELGRFDVVTRHRGWQALADVDLALEDRGFVRAGPWEIGSGRGYVAWIEPNYEQILTCPADNSGEVL